MYESPVYIVQEQLANQMRLLHEDHIYRTILAYDIQVNKDELLRALRYDRHQYQKGFVDGGRDGYLKRDAEIVRCKDCVHWYDREEVCLKIYSDGTVSPYAWQFRKPDDFCSYGERKDDQ